MGKQFTSLDTNLRDFIAKQKMYFVATAPLAENGHVNVSPKGLDTFRVLDDHTVAYLDFTGSGAETIAHLRENGRITLMFCAFEGPPKILRLYGTGRALLPRSRSFQSLRPLFPQARGVRSIIRVKVERIADSCGYAVPQYQFIEDRRQLTAWFDRKSDAEIDQYRAEKNAESIDGLPALVGRRRSTKA